jgi:hypothetical protein
MDLKRKYNSIFQSKKVIRASTYELSSLLKKLETKQTKTLFFTAVEIVPTRLRRILG